jgi:hypothetical protein
MQLRDLMDLISDAEYLQDFEDSNLGRDWGELNPERVRNLPPNEFKDFFQRVDTLIKGVVKLKETNL